MKMNKLKQTETYYRKKRIIPSVVMANIQQREIIYGARAINKQLPNFLRRNTEDWDIFAQNPKKEAKEIEKALDKSFGGDYFIIEPAKHKGTWKVKDKIRKETIVDYTKPNRKKIPNRLIGGKRYVTLDYVKKHINKTLKDESAKYRWDKDKDVLNRILVFEKLKQMK
jgi:hypothetical protein